MKALINHIEKEFQLKILSPKSLSGGDISQVFLLEAQERNFVLKVNDVSKLNMFLAEALGLKNLRKPDILSVPKVFGVDKFETKSYILLEYIKTGKANRKTYSEFGEKLAALHQVSSEKFGFVQDNYIGSLSQSNQQHILWEEFYWYERIQPQMRLAARCGLLSKQEMPSKDKFIQVIKNEFVPHPPGLLHGDLWNGNYMIDANGDAVLIDPSVYYGHPMMDLGMTRLFDGFPKEFYDAYFYNSSISGNMDVQVELSQLYYLLVHLNLFGRGYHSSVLRILKKYFDIK